MSPAETKLRDLLQQVIAKPNIEQNDDSVIAELDQIIEALKPTRNQLFARATVLRHSLVPYTDLNSKQEILTIYKNLVETNPEDSELHLEASRAFAVFDDLETAANLLTAACKVLNFSYNLSAIELRPTKYQEKAVHRLSCVTQGCVADEHEQVVNESIEYVALNSEYQLDVPSFCNDKDKVQCTDRHADLAYIVLLIQAELSLLNSSLNDDSSALPYIQRITESKDFNKIHWAVQERALYERSIHETEDVEHLERSTVQLIKIANSLHSAQVDSEHRLRYVYLLPPLSWRRVDEMAARRLVAMSDFANAVPFYERLRQPLELAMCYSAIGDNENALAALNSPELTGNAKAIMMRGDIEQNPSYWEEAWNLGKLPEAKLRLAQKSAGDEDALSVQTHLDELLEVYPSNHSALCLSGMTALGMKNWPRAAQQLRRSLAINEDDPRSWSNLSTALLYLEQPEQALVALKQALRTNKNSEADLKTLFNFVALSAQLANYDDVVRGLSDLCSQADKGSAQYVARIAGTLPRVVTYFVSQPFKNNPMQSRVVNLFRKELLNVIPDDDPMLSRLTGKIEFWTGRYWAGFAAYSTALKSTVKSAESGNQRDWLRLKLYATEYAEALERDGDKEGRIEGSKACPDYKTQLLEAQRLINECSRQLKQ